jgi:superfamily II DNA/RNA helicase
VAAAAIHGDRSQAQRTRALASFTDGKTQALVGTDVVARGIHVDAVPCVVHFDPADDPNVYVHRSGRTGRSGHTGTVVSLVPNESRAETRALQRALGLRPLLGDPFVHDPEAAVAQTVTLTGSASNSGNDTRPSHGPRRDNNPSRRRRSHPRSGSGRPSSQSRAR